MCEAEHASILKKEIENLKQTVNEFNLIIDACHDAIVIVNNRGVIERVNPAYERIARVKAEKVVGRNMKDLELEGFVSHSVSLKVLHDKKANTIMQQMKTGSQVLYTGIPIRDDNNNILKVICTGRDMTELNEIKAELDSAKILAELYKRELEETHRQKNYFKGIVYVSEGIEKIIDLARKVAKTDSTVLITGESGVGKELIAKVIHSQSLRADKPFVKINTSAIPDNLLESELFGYEEGAFSGAKRGGKLGLFEVAEKGTVFLDEIGELSYNMQAKLLRFLQEKEFTRVGGTSTIKVDTRVIAATNVNLTEKVKTRQFREDLYYRLNVIPIAIPPLRERKEDILPLIIYFLKIYCQKYNFEKKISQRAMEKLFDYQWPGNVRELQNVIERLLVTANDEILEEDVSFLFKKNKVDVTGIEINEIITLQEAYKQVEELLISKALLKHKTVRAAAKVLGVNASTVVRKRQKYQCQG